MKLKERDNPKFSSRFIGFKKSIKQIVLNKKTTILVFVGLGLALLILGLFAGMLFSKFFGTLDEPSQRMLSLIKSAGFTDLESLKLTFENIREENIKIPFNYLSSQFVDVKKMYIDIGFEDYKKLEYKREQALSLGFLEKADDDWVPANVKYEGEKSPVNLRLKGDWLDHLKTDKWSLRIEVDKDGTLDGMSVFSIQNPEVRNYLSEFLFHSALKREGVISLRYEFVEIIINGENKGIYALEEHFTKELIEENNRREGVIIAFDETPYRTAQFREVADTIFFPENPEFFYTMSTPVNFETNSILEDPIKSSQLERANNLLESFKRGELKTSQVFDCEKLSKFWAIATMLGAQHGTAWENVRFYYNPVTSLLEPIGYDASLRSSTYKSELLEQNFPSCMDSSNSQYNIDASCVVNINNFRESISSDPIFFERFIKELERISNETYLDSLFKDLDAGLKENLRIIHKDTPTYHFPKEIFYYNVKYFDRLMNPPKSLEANFKESSQNAITLGVANLNKFPIEILSVSYQNSTIFSIKNPIILQPKSSLEDLKYKDINFNIPLNFVWNDSMKADLRINYKIFGTESVKNQEISPWEYFNVKFANEDFLIKDGNVSSNDFVEINKESKRIIIKEGNWMLNESLIIPAGFNVIIEKNTLIDLRNSAMILSYSPLNFEGSESNEIKITSSDGTGEGITVLNANGKSYLNYVNFEKLRNPIKDGWELTGAINFYESPIEIKNVKISDMMNSEDGVNIIRSKFKIDNLNFNNSFSDCLDFDFSYGNISNSKFLNCGADALDFSGSIIQVSNSEIEGSGDKGISAGEESKINIKNVKISKGYIGIASKDNSIAKIENSEINNCRYGLAAYQKKPEFGPASIEAIKTSISNCELNYLIEKKSSLSMDRGIILGDQKEVYKLLYGKV